MVSQTPQQNVKTAPPQVGYAPMAMAEWCRVHDEPYFAISAPDQAGYLLRPLSAPMDAKRTVLNFERPAVFAARASRVTAVPHEGFLCTPDLCLIYEGLAARDYVPMDDLGGYCKGADANGRFLMALSDFAAPVREECVFFGGNKNFGHFVFQNLTRLSLLNWVPQLRALPIAVFEGLPRRFLEFLDILGYPKERRIVIPNAAPVPFDRVWMLSSPMYRHSATRPMIWPESIWALRAALARFTRPIAGGRPRYYLPRGNAAWRRLINEPQLIEIMARYGVQPIEFGTLSAIEQIQTISNAEVMVGVLGAASAITAFAPSDCAVIDLSPPGFAGTFGPAAFAAVLSQPYARLFGREVTQDEVAAAGLPPSAGDKKIDIDFHIDPQQFEQLLGEADAHTRRLGP